MTMEDANAVLIVDNDDHVLRAIEKMLEKEGFHTQTTWSGHEALALLKSRQFEVLLVGDYLADLHSTDFLRRVCKLRRPPAMVVMQNGTSTPAELRRYSSLGAAAVANKSNLDEIREMISTLCHRRLGIPADVH
jgi:DNA-binding NtrC family response regulator